LEVNCQKEGGDYKSYYLWLVFTTNPSEVLF